MPTHKTHFYGDGGNKLAAVWQMPPLGKPRAAALFAHCFTCGKDIFAARHIAAALARRGIAVLRFDFAGLGESAGNFVDATFSSNVADLRRAADFMREQGMPPALLVGHSLGGAAALAAAEGIEEARAVATIAAPAEPSHMMRHFADKRAEIEQKGAAEVLIAGRPFVVGRPLLQDIEQTRLQESIARLNKTLFVFHSVADKTVGIENARKIYKAAAHPKSFVCLDKADHLLSNRQDAEYVAATLAAWARRHLPPPAEDANGANAPKDGAVTVESVGDGLTQRVAVGGHEWLMDEPRAMGGADAGATPAAHALAALGACTAITLRMYAKRKNFRLDGVSVFLRRDSAAGAPAIFRSIVLRGDFSPAQRERMLAIANKCPVYKMLAETAAIKTVVEE